MLQAHGKLTGRELAARLEVSPRTAHRDMEALSAAGVPVFALRGAHGGWQLDEEWRMQVPGLDEAELRAFLMAQPRVVGDGPLAAAAERALNKLMAARPVTMRARAAFIRQRLFVDTTGWRGKREDLSFLPIVQDAISRDRKLTMSYRRADRESVERILDPLGLVAKGSTWYLVAKTPSGLRTYRVSRIEKASVLDVPSERPSDFDLAAYWKTSTDEFREKHPSYTAILRAEPKTAEDMMRWHSCVAVGEADAEGWMTMRVDFDDEEQACFIARGLGPRAVLVEPQSLRDRLIADANALLDRLTPRRAGDTRAE